VHPDPAEVATEFGFGPPRDRLVQRLAGVAQHLGHDVRNAIVVSGSTGRPGVLHASDLSARPSPSIGRTGIERKLIELRHDLPSPVEPVHVRYRPGATKGESAMAYIVSSGSASATEF
jgi:hypothetical protein